MIVRAECGVVVDPARIEQQHKRLRRVQTEMMLALGADAPVWFEVLLPDNRAAALALGPQPFGLHAALVGRRGLIDPLFLSLKPGHGRIGSYFNWSLWVAVLIATFKGLKNETFRVCVATRA